MSLPSDLDFTKNPSASPARMDLAMTNIDTRLKALETYKPNFDALFQQLQAIGLQRIADAVAPVYAALVGVADLGAIFTSSSTTLNTVGLGLLTFAVPSADQTRFAPSGYMIAVSSADTRNAVSGRASYDRSTGFLTIDAVLATGSGQHADWKLMPTVPPLTTVAGIDGGSDDAPALQSVPYIASDALATETMDYDAGVDGLASNIPPVVFDNGTA